MIINAPDYRFPDYMQCVAPGILHAMRRYILVGVPVGDFLTALFSNDLMEAMVRADDNNKMCMFEFAMFLYNEAPSHPIRCYGSKKIVKEWIVSGGMAGKLKLDPKTFGDIGRVEFRP